MIHLGDSLANLGYVFTNSTQNLSWKRFFKMAAYWLVLSETEKTRFLLKLWTLYAVYDSS